MGADGRGIVIRHVALSMGGSGRLVPVPADRALPPDVTPALEDIFAGRAPRFELRADELLALGAVASGGAALVIAGVVFAPVIAGGTSVGAAGTSVVEGLSTLGPGLTALLSGATAGGGAAAGGALAEYGIVLALLAVATVPALQFIGSQIPEAVEDLLPTTSDTFSLLEGSYSNDEISPTPAQPGAGALDDYYFGTFSRDAEGSLVFDASGEAIMAVSAEGSIQLIPSAPAAAQLAAFSAGAARLGTGFSRWSASAPLTRISAAGNTPSAVTAADLATVLGRPLGPAAAAAVVLDAVGGESRPVDAAEARATALDAAPLIYDYDGDGALAVLGGGTVSFDWDRDGFAEATSWVGPNDAFIVVDLDGDGQIGADELTLRRPGLEGRTVIERLAAGFDSNGDGRFDAGDRQWSAVRVWRDVDSDGVVDARELMSAAKARLTGIDLAASPPAEPDAWWIDTDADGRAEVLRLRYGANAVAPEGGIAAEILPEGILLGLGTANAGSRAIGTIALFHADQGTTVSRNGSRLIRSGEDGTVENYVFVRSAAGETVTLAAGSIWGGALGNVGDDILDGTGAGRGLILTGGGGNDRITGGAGDDVIDGGAGADRLAGGGGNDAIVADAADLAGGLVSGGTGRDALFIATGSGDLAVDLAALGIEQAFGDSGKERFDASRLAVGVVLGGGGGHDTLIGGAGNDVISGDAGQDRLLGGAGDDTLYATGDDLLISGGAGIDTVIFGGSLAAALRLDTHSIERAFGGLGGDTLDGRSQTAALVIDGGGGNDVLVGGRADDLLRGGAGNDILTGGAGTDRALYDGAIAGYAITTRSDGSTEVRDIDASDGDDGTDVVRQVERLIFADGSVHTSGPANARPVATGESWRLPAGRTAQILLAAALTANDRDADGDVLAVTAIGAVEGGTVSIDAAGNVLFADGAGDGRFTYRVEDGHGGRAFAEARVEAGPALPADPLLADQWGLTAMNVPAAWQSVTGAGVRIAVVDEGIDIAHPDIAAHYDAAHDGAVTPGTGHGTWVASIAAGAADGAGMVGVAPDASLAFFGQPLFGISWLYGGGADVMAASWTTGNGGLFYAGGSQQWAVHGQVLAGFAQTGRGGLGSISVFAAANSGATGGDANQYGHNATRHVIVVGAMDAEGRRVAFSAPGANVLVSAPGAGILGADLAGAAGYSQADDYYGADFVVGDGTSGSAPFVAGVAALLLEANPGLGWRDVQEILALSAWQPDAGTGSYAANGAATWNGGGLLFSRDVGFGMVDARAAVRLAESWSGGHDSANERALHAAGSRAGGAIADLGTFSATARFTGPLDVDHVTLTLDLAHGRVGDLVIELISPAGTRVVVLDRIGKAPDAPDATGSAATGFTWSFDIVDFWGENSLGTWTLNISDRNSGMAGQVNSWSLTAYGDAASADTRYVYTDAFGRMGAAAEAGRRLLADSGGHDTLNAAAVTSGTVLDLGTGGVIAGTRVAIATGTVIEDALLGDGNDIARGNAAANRIDGGRGDDVLEGGAGADRLDGSDGFDTLSYAGAAGAVAVSLSTGRGTAGEAAGDGVAGFERLVGSAHGDTLEGSARDDILVGNGGDDALDGGAGDDALDGGAGADRLAGGAGNDRLTGGAGRDSIDGGAGIDTAVFSGAFADYAVSLGGAGTARISGPDGTDIVTTTEILAFADRNLWIGGGSNSAPVVGTLSLVASQHRPVTISASRLLAAATDADRDALSLAWVSRTDGALVTLDADGSVAVLPDADFLGTITLTFGISDGRGGEGTGTLRVAVPATATFSGTAAADAFRGLASRDTVSGKGGDDMLDGGAGDDLIDGGDGNDTLIGGAGADDLRGGNGIDTVTFAAARTAVALNLGTGGTAGEAAGDRFRQIEVVVGSPFDDTLAAYASVGSILLGGAGNDTLTGGSGADRLSGEAGGDHLAGGGGNDALDGGDGQDVLRGEAGNDVLEGGEGNDTLMGGAGADVLRGGAGFDQASYADATAGIVLDRRTASNSRGDAAGDTFLDIEGFLGSAHADTFRGLGSADESFDGAAGNDLLDGGAGNDTYLWRAGEGDDRIFDFISYAANVGSADTLRLAAGLEADDVILQRSGDGVTLRFAGRTGSVMLADQFAWRGVSGVETIVFGDGESWSADDLVTHLLAQAGTAGDDVIEGFANRADLIDGGAGNDTLTGLGGGDTFIGGAGADRLYGNLGSDTFRYQALSDSSRTGPDIIFNFNYGVNVRDDILDLSAIDTDPTRAGDQAFAAFIGSSAFSGSGIAQVRSYTSGSFTWVEADTGDGIADLVIGINRAHTLTADQFRL